MLTIRQAGLVALVGAACLAIPSVWADTLTALQPCSSPSDTTAHAIVVDANCQKISDTGAFSILQLGSYSGNTKIGFSTTDNCAKTYVPSMDELNSLVQAQSCTAFVTNSGKTSADAGGTPPSNPPAKPAPAGLRKRDFISLFKKRDDTKEQGSDGAAHQVPLTYVVLVEA